MNPHGHDIFSGHKLTKGQKKAAKRRRRATRMMAQGLNSALTMPDRPWFSLIVDDQQGSNQ